MNTIQGLYQQAQLAEAAYANFINPNTGAIYITDAGIQAALQDTANNSRFSQSQATAFVTQWRVRKMGSGLAIQH